MNWTLYEGLDEFSPAHLYDVLKLRQDIFIIEQQCIYDDIDGIDRTSTHLLMQENDELVGYLRIVPPGIKFEEFSLGRIIVRETHRSRGLGQILVREGIDLIRRQTAEPIRIEAQAHLENFYSSLGFRSVSDIYSVDDIPHLQMVIYS